MRRVAITGMIGYLGCQLACELERDPDVELILGLDLNPLRPGLAKRFSKLAFIQHDVAEPCGNLFLEHWLDSAVHFSYCVTRLRPVIVPGPGASHSVALVLASNPRVLSRRMNPIQRCHVDDVVRVTIGLMQQAWARGAFNVAPEDVTQSQEIGHVVSHRKPRIPDRLLQPVDRVGWRYRLGWPRSVPPEAIACFCSSGRVSSRLLRQKLDFSFHFSSRKALRSFANACEAHPF